MGVCAERTLIERVSHTHSVCPCVLAGTLQPKQHFKWVWLIGGGGAERGLTGKLAVQGIRGTLALAHTHAFIPLFTLDQPLAALFLSGQAPFHLSQMSSLHCLHFSIHAFFFLPSHLSN